MVQSFKTAFSFIVFLLAATMSCHEKGPGPDFIKFFDQKAFFEHLGEHYITSGYQDFTEKTTLLDTAINRLIRETTQDNLTEARQTLKSAWLSWQFCAPFDFGPAYLLETESIVNPFPADTVQIEKLLTGQNYNLNLPENSHAKGFAGLDYILNSNDLNDEELLLLVNTSLPHQGYLITVSGNIAFAAEKVYQSWAATGANYYKIFTADEALGFEKGSSLAELINGLSRSLEFSTARAKVSVPVGDYNENEPLPEMTEAFYGGYSLELLKANVKSYQLIFSGTSRNGIDSPGFDEYLDIRGAKFGDSDQPLSAVITAVLEGIEKDLEQLQDPFSDQILTNRQIVQHLDAQLLLLVSLLKNEMAPALRVEIIY